VGRKNRRNYMLGDQVEVEIQKVDALRHQIDLAVVLPEGVMADGDGLSEELAEGADGVDDATHPEHEHDPFAPIPVLSEA
jgi:ribonuclease R